MKRPALWIRDGVVELRSGLAVNQSKPFEPPCDLDAAGQAATELLRDADIAAVEVVLSSWHAFTHEIELAVRRPTGDMLRYAFEEFVPVDIESLTCAFAPSERDRWIAVGVDTDSVRGLLGQIDQLGVAIESVTLDIVAAANVSGAANVAIVDDRHVALVQRSRSHVRRLSIHRRGNSPIVTPIEATLGQSEGACDEWAICRLSDDLTAAPVTTRRDAIDLNLASGELALGAAAIRPLRAVRDGLALTCAALLVLAGGFWMQRASAQVALGAVRDWETALFIDLFPEAEPPRSVSLRLRSERKRLAEITAEPSAASALDPLATLRAIVLAIPRETRIQIEQIQIEPRDVILRGAARDHGQAELFARGIDAIDSLSCPTPRTERLAERGVQFFAHAKAEEPEAHDGD